MTANKHTRIIALHSLWQWRNVQFIEVALLQGPCSQLPVTYGTYGKLVGIQEWGYLRSRQCDKHHSLRVGCPWTSIGLLPSRQEYHSKLKLRRNDNEERKKKREMVKYSLISRPRPAFCHLQYSTDCKPWKAEQGLGTRLGQMLLPCNWAIGAPALEQKLNGIYPEMQFDWWQPWTVLTEFLLERYKCWLLILTLFPLLPLIWHWVTNLFSTEHIHWQNCLEDYGVKLLYRKLPT